MKAYHHDSHLSSMLMNCLRTRLRLPVTVLMLASLLVGTLPGNGATWTAASVVISGAIDTETRVVRLIGDNVTAGLKPGMTVSGSGIPAGSYIVQILSANQVLLNQEISSTNSNVALTIDDVEFIGNPITGDSDWTKTGSGKAVLAASNTSTGTITIQDGLLQAGGISYRGRNIIHDVLSNTGSIVFGNSGAPTLSFIVNMLNTAPFERVGSLAGGSDNATILLTGDASNTLLAFGGNNASTTFTGSIIGGVNTSLIKEGSGVFTWINNNATSFTGSVQIEAGGMVIGGSAGLGKDRLVGEGLGSSIILSNLPGASLTLASGGTEVVGFLAGGGRGASRAFPNGAAGALLGNYLGQSGGELILANTNLILDNSTANQVFPYGGAISGTGNLTKIGNNILELLGNSTYNGETRVQAVEVNGTNSVVRLGAYGIHAGVGQLESAGFGSLPETTRLLLVAGNAGFNRHATFDLNGATQKLSTLNSFNDGGLKTVLLRGGVLTIHTVSGNSGSFNGVFSGRGIINVTATTGDGGWTLTSTDQANNNTSQRGELNVLGGRVTFNDSRSGALGDSVHVHVGEAGTLAVALTETVGSLSGSGLVEIAAGQRLVLSTAPAGSIYDKAWTGVIRSPDGGGGPNGNGGVTLAPGASLLLRADQEYRGSTRVQSGSALHLDYTAGATNLIPGILELNGGSLFLLGDASSESLDIGAILEAGASVVSSVRGQTAAPIHFGQLSRNAVTGGTLLVYGNSVITSSSGQAALGGILGGYAVHRSLDALGMPQYGWAVPGAGGTSIGALGAYSNAFGSGLNTDVTFPLFDDSTQNKFSGSTGSLRFNTPESITLTLGGVGGNQTTTIESGGILVTPEVGNHNILIRDQAGGTEQLFGGSTGKGVERELIVHQYNPRGTLTIQATIADNGGPSRLTKTGPGTLILDRGNTYTGQTAIYGGVLQVGTGSTIGTLGNGSQPVINHGYLVVNRSNAYTISQAITGSGTLRQAGAGTLTLAGNSAYTGPTQVRSGILVASSPGALGSTDGLTTVSPGATLRLNSVTTPETVVLQGASLETMGSGVSTFRGGLILNGDSNITLGGTSASLFLEGRIKTMGNSTLTLGGAGRLILSNAANQIHHLTIGSNTEVMVGGDLATPTLGSLGRGTVVNNGKIIINTGAVSNDVRASGQLVVPNTISGTGGFQVVRGTVYLTGNNTFSGPVLIGGNLGGLSGAGMVGLANSPADLRIGADTYTGSLGTGEVTVQAATGNPSSLRFHLARNEVINNTINLNPYHDGTNSRNAQLLRQGLGSITLAGVINAGAHNVGPAGAQNQRAVLQSESGGRLIITGTLNSGPTNRLNIVNNGFVAFSGSKDYDLWGVISGNNSLVFNTTGTVTVQTALTAAGAAVQSLTSTSNTYLQVGRLVINSEASDAIHDDQDIYVLRGATLQLNYSENIGAVMTQTGAQILLGDGVTLRVNDNGTRGSYGSITGAGTVHYDAVGGAAWYGAFGLSDYTGDVLIGGTGQIATVRVDNVADAGKASALGMGSVILLGMEGSSQEARLEYTGAGHSTDRTIMLNGTSMTARIAGNGRGALVLNGDIVVNGNQNKTLMLHGQNATGNTINGMINEGSGKLALIVNPNVANNDLYGAGRWTLTNAGNNFSGNVTVGVGMLILNGSLGDGTGTSSVLGNLDATRVIQLGTNNFDGRRYAYTGGSDNLGASSGLNATGILLFNDPDEGVAVLGSNITFTTGDHSSTTNAGHARLVNDGAKVIIIEGKLTSGAGNNRNWYLDGSNTGTNTIRGVISNASSAVVSLIKEGAGTWRLEGENTFTGGVTITRGTLELASGKAVADAAIVTLSNAGSDGSSVEAATLRVLATETIGGLTGGVGTSVQIAGGSTLRLLSAASQTYNGVISGEGGLWRDGDGTARVQTLTNLNTYTGSTQLVSTSNIAHRIDVHFLADGGQASGIGASSNAASNLVFSLGTGNGGLRWIGTTNQTTDRLFTLGAGAGAANIWGDGQLFGDFAPSIKFTNTGAIAFLTPNTSQTLTLRGARITENEFSPQINNNGAGITSLVKSEAGQWILNGANTFSGGTTIRGGTLAVTHSSALGTGPVVVSGGAGIGLDLRNNVTITNAFSNTVSQGVLSSSSGDNTYAGTITIGGNTNWVVATSGGASLNITGAITGSTGTGRLVKADRGTLILSGANTYTGITSLTGGTTVLNYDTNAGGTNSSKLSDGHALELGFSAINSSGFVTGLGSSANVSGQTNVIANSGATLILRGGSHEEVVASTTIRNGANRILREEGSSAILRMGTIARTTSNGVNDNGTLDFGSTGIAHITNTNTHDILVVSSAFATVNGTHWATAGNALVGAYTSYATADAATAIMANTHANLVASRTQGAVTPYTLRFDSSDDITLTLTGALGLVDGGILVPKGMTGNVTITGGSVRRSTTTANLDTVIHHYGDGTLTILSPIVNNTNLQGLTKTGPGTVIIGGANTITGRVSIQEGVLQVGDGTLNTANARLGVQVATAPPIENTNPISLSEGATLRINVANAAHVFTSGTLLGGGLLHLAPTNTSTYRIVNDNGNWQGAILLEGGVLQVRGNNSNPMGGVRNTLTIRGDGRLDLNGVSATLTKRMTLEPGAEISVTANGATMSTVTLSGVIRINGDTPEDVLLRVDAGQALTMSGMIRTTSGFSKSGNGILTLSANQFQSITAGAQAGSTTPNDNPALLGQVWVKEGELRLGNARSLGAVGVGNETIIFNGATLDLRGQALNWADYAEASREIIRISGAGVNGTGALRNSTGTGVFSHLALDGDATISGGGYAVTSRLVLATYDTNPNTGSNFEGNLTRNRPIIEGNNHILTVRAGSQLNDATGAGVTLRDPQFSSPLQQLVVGEGMLRIEKDFGPLTDFSGVSASDITGGILLAYSGASLADLTNPSLGLGPIMGSRLNFWNNTDLRHTVNIIMDGTTAAQNGGHNSIDMGGGTIPNARTYLDGQITLMGPATRNLFNIEATTLNGTTVTNQSTSNNTIVEQANQTSAIQVKLIVGGQIVGSGGLTKTGTRELRLSANNTFTGDVNVVRSGFVATRWQDNTVRVNGVDYQTYGDAEGWGEWGLTLAGSEARLSGTSNINLQRRGMITLDNTTRLDATTFLGSEGSGGNHNNRINDAASLNFENGLLRIIGGTVNNTEALATAGSAAVNVLSGSNYIDLMPTEAGAAMTLTIGRINRSPGSVLTLRNLDSTSTFGTISGPDTVRVQLNSTSGLTLVGAGSEPTNKPIVIGVLGGIIPHTYLDDVRNIGYNNANASDYITQGRNMQNMAGSHFMTYDGNILRPLNASEYFTPVDGLLDNSNGSAGQNVNLVEAYSRVRENVTINSLRFGPVADQNGGGTGINDGTTLTSYTAAHAIQLYVDGTLNISSGMVSSANFTVGNTSNLATLIVGGTLNFGQREAIINNQNGMVRLTDGQAVFGNFEIRSAIAGSGGLTKTGSGVVYMDGANTYSGVTTVSEGILYLRNGRQALGAGGAGNGVVLQGTGSLYSSSGIQVGSADAFEDILVKPVASDIHVMRTENDATRWFSNVTIDNVDLAGLVVQTPRISAANSATGIFMGNIVGGSTPITHNINATLSRIVQVDAANNVMVFRGVFGDKADPITGRPVPIPDTISTLPSQPGIRTNQNEVLRVTLAGSAESNFYLERQYNAAGRLTLNNGTLMITYDPHAAGNDGSGFWTDTAISRIVGGDSSSTAFAVNSGVNQQGFTMALGSLFLTRDGQHFNMSGWNATGNGAKYMGGLNTSGTVVFGTPNSTGTLVISNSSSSTTAGQMRSYAAPGGTVELHLVIQGNPGTAASYTDIGFAKIGRGTVILKNNTQDASATSSFDLGGGVLVLDHDGKNLPLLGANDAILNGGVLHVRGHPTERTLGSYAVTNAANNQLQLRTGGTEVIAESRGQDVLVTLGNIHANAGTATLTRAAGATLNLVSLINGGGIPTISVNSNDVNSPLVRGEAIPWVTYSTQPRTAEDFGFIDGGSIQFSATRVANSRELTNISPPDSLRVGMVITGTGYATNTVVVAVTSETTATLSANATEAGTGTATASYGVVERYLRAPSDYENSPANWLAGMNVSENAAGFSGVLGSSLGINTLRFDSAQASQVQIASGQTLSLAAGGNIAGAILVSSNTGNADKAITGGNLTTSSPELIFHQYGLGTLDVASRITGNANVVITGPVTTGEGQYGTTGTVRFHAGNTYNGRTIITGSVLEIDDISALGANPVAVESDRLTLNGGSLRWTGGSASLQNRGVRLEGGGGVIDVVNPDANLFIGDALTGTEASLTSQDVLRGDLIKMGQGTLTLLGVNSGFQGLLDVREGTLIGMADNGDANAGVAALFGTNRSHADGTIMRQGTNLQLFLGNGNNGGDWTIEEHFIFEGGNTFTYGGLLDISVSLASGGALDDQFNLGSRRPLNLNGMIRVDGPTEFMVTNNAILRLGNSSGYVYGSGDIIKDGAGQMHFRTNSPDWTGGLVVREGSVYVSSQVDVLGTGYESGRKIILGDSERQGIAEVLIQNPDNITGSWIMEIRQDVEVVYNPLQTKRLGTDNLSNGNRVTFHGDITLNDNLVLLVRDVSISSGGEHVHVNFNGRLRDGEVTSGNLVVQGDDSNTTVNDLTSGRTYGYANLNGDNSGWTGDVTIGNNLAYNHDSTAVLRLGHDKALGAANEVTMNFNSILQAGGRNVSIGSLITMGGDGAFFGDAGTMSANVNASSEIVENAASTPGILRIHQGTPSANEAAWDAFFRDGTLNSQFLAPGANVLQPSAALNLVKDGEGWATLTLDNDYTGSTTVAAGILQVGRDGTGTTGRVGAAGTLVQSGARIAGSGTVRGNLTLQSGAALRPGDQAGGEIGTLFVDGDAIFASGSQVLMQLRMPSYNNPGALTAVRNDGSEDPLYDIWRSGVASPGDSFASALDDLVTASQHDVLHAGGTIHWGVGSQITLTNDGYTPKAGDVFRLFNGNGYNGVLNVGPGLRVGNEIGTDLNLFELGGNFLWDVSLFNSHGIVMVVEADALPMTVPPPVITSGPSRTPATGVFEPGETVTLSVAATGAGPLSYQWYLNGVPLVDDNVTIQGAKTPLCQVVVNFNTKGVYSVSVTNEGGTTVAPNSVLVQVKDLPQITVHPTPRTVNPGSVVEFTVLASGQEPFDYQWLRNNTPIEGANEQTLVIDPVAEEDEGVYSVRISNEAGEVVSNGAQLTVNDPVSYAVAQFSPFPRAYLGQTITFSVLHDGTPRSSGEPFSYQWRKGGVPIDGGNKATLVLPNATSLMEGTYDVVVTNGVNSRTSETVTLTLGEPQPVIEAHPVATQTLLSGQALSLSVQAAGRQPLTYTWKRNGAIVASGASNNLMIPQSAVSDGGVYVCEVANDTAVTAVSNPAEVVVVDSVVRVTPVGLGEPVELVARVEAGADSLLVFHWRKNGVPLDPESEDNAHITGINESRLIFESVGAADDALYTCEIRGNAENTVIGSGCDVRVFSGAPQLAPFEFTDATIYAGYEFEVPYNRVDRSLAPSSVTATGLPPGLTIDSVTGVISGRPTAVRKGGYPVTITVANSYGSVQQTAVLTVQDFSQTLAGAWTGVFNRGGEVDGKLGGRVDFTVTAKATYSGKLLIGGVTYSFKGSLEVEDADGATIQIEIPRKGKPAPAPLQLTLELEGNEIIGGSVDDGGTSSTLLGGWRLSWGTKAPLVPATAYLGYHTFGLALAEDSGQIGSSNVPQGSGYAAFTATANGKLKLAGRMADGEAVTIATHLGPNGEIGIFQPMYKALKPGGSLVGTLKIDDAGTATPDDNTLVGQNLTWVRPASSKDKDRLYRAGFGIAGTPVAEPVPLIAVGGRYIEPDAKANQVLLDMPAAPSPQVYNARIRFSDAGDLEDPALTRLNPDVEFSIGPKTKVTVPKTQLPDVNPAGTKVAAKVKTGAISGSFTLNDRTPTGYSPVAQVKRAVKFQGMVIRDNGRWVGVGYFLLPQLPQVGPPYTTAKNSPILSGLLLLEDL